MAEAGQSIDGVSRLSLSTTTGFLVAGVIVIFIFFVLAFFCFLRANRYWGAIPVISRGAPAADPPPCRGLDAVAVAALAPPVVIRAGDLKEGLECPVCLSELSEGETARLLPKCGHAFHLECIDMWFCSHSTCPLCRTPAALEEPKAAGAAAAEPAHGDAQSSADEQTFSGNSSSQDESSGSPDSSSASPPVVLVIEVPRRAAERSQTSNSALTASRLQEENTSPPTLRSWRRLLVLGSRVSRGCDIEQGRGSAPKAPASS
ncbi:hypothetical protein Cni_G11390 [Canna indica]|uniref:RING-type E3 ubiquitin transferase n=1 Tax=Canna indica TaxID=4628 RepID=A0AAQ3QAU3_9LILI|nr:hypothetical protein Cni_G11390 [Canna indica]